MLKQISRISGLLLVSLIFPLLASAQSAPHATLSVPDIDRFPLITAYLDARDAQEGFLSGLQAGDITIIENDLELPALELAELQTGVQFVVAINPATSFAIPDEQLIKRYDYLAQNLEVWASVMDASSNDDLSLVTPAEKLINHESDYSAWLVDFGAYEPDYDTAVPTLESLGTAIDYLAAETTPRPGMNRAVLWLTSTLNPVHSNALQSYIEQAKLAQVRIFVWMIDSQRLFDSLEADELRAVAAQTGGQFFAFSGIEPLPDLQANLDSIRQIYQLSYHSAVTVAGAYNFSVILQKDDWQAVSGSQSFEVQLQAPNPIFVSGSPPSQILRAQPEDAEAGDELLPSEQLIEIWIEFPDSIDREIVRTTLYANGEMVSENTSSPFDQFTWDLTGYNVSERVILVVEAEDEMGFSNTSIGQPVQITIQRAPGGISAVFTRYGSILGIGLVTIAGLVLLLVLLLAGRIQPRPMAARRRAKASYEDPVTQPVKDMEQSIPQPTRLAQFASRFSAPRLQWPQLRPLPKPLAYLVPISDSGEPQTSGTFQITSSELTFGAALDQVNIPIDDPAVEDIHARLWQDEKGIFHLADQGSVAGTWINYAPVSNGGSQVEQGDLIHIGRAGFRFTLNKPGQPRMPENVREEIDK
ncbi:MAG: FHA domain-containing protein [Chloroflexi bacterium]|nr:FHA domain-containing protein [Chloroflexota bacterium]